MPPNKYRPRSFSRDIERKRSYHPGYDRSYPHYGRRNDSYAGYSRGYKDYQASRRSHQPVKDNRRSRKDVGVKRVDRSISKTEHRTPSKRKGSPLIIKAPRKKVAKPVDEKVTDDEEEDAAKN